MTREELLAKLKGGVCSTLHDLIAEEEICDCTACAAEGYRDLLKKVEGATTFTEVLEVMQDSAWDLEVALSDLLNVLDPGFTGERIRIVACPGRWNT